MARCRGYSTCIPPTGTCDVSAALRRRVSLPSPYPHRTPVTSVPSFRRSAPPYSRPLSFCTPAWSAQEITPAPGRIFRTAAFCMSVRSHCLPSVAASQRDLHQCALGQGSLCPVSQAHRMSSVPRIGGISASLQYRRASPRRPPKSPRHLQPAYQQHPADSTTIRRAVRGDSICSAPGTGTPVCSTPDPPPSTALPLRCRFRHPRSAARRALRPLA